jgi:selenocysteine-specific translation elongation factor
MRDYLDNLGVPRLPVATKWDRLSAREQSSARRRLEAAHGRVIPVSSKTGEGIEDLRREIRSRLNVEKGGDTAHG